MENVIDAELSKSDCPFRKLNALKTLLLAGPSEIEAALKDFMIVDKQERYGISSTPGAQLENDPVEKLNEEIKKRDTMLA